MRMALALNNLKRVDMPLNKENQTKPSIPGHVIPKTLKMVLDISLLNMQ